MKKKCGTILLVTALGCAAGRLERGGYEDGEWVKSRVHRFRHAALSQSEDRWVVELRPSSCNELLTLLFLDVAHINAIRVTLPRDPQVGVAYPIGLSDGEAIVEVRAFLARAHRPRWGTVQLSRWDPKKPYVEGTFDIPGERHIWTVYPRTANDRGKFVRTHVKLRAWFKAPCRPRADQP